jgi:hypothetical protein
VSLAIHTRKDGHKYVTAGRFIAAVAFGCICVPLVAFCIAWGMEVAGLGTGTPGPMRTLRDIVGITTVSGLFAPIGVIPGGFLALAAMRKGKAGWLVAILLGMGLAMILMFLFSIALEGGLRDPSDIGISAAIYGAFGALYALSLWWGFRIFAPDALIAEPPSDP